MLKDLVELLRQDAVQPYYIGLCMAMMVLPCWGLRFGFTAGSAPPRVAGS